MLGLAVFTIVQLWLGVAAKPRAIILALKEEEVRELTARSGYSLQDFWERAQAIGARAVVLSPESAQSLWERGEILHFTESHALAWPWVNASAVAKGNTLWTHNRTLLQRLQTSAASQKVAFATASVGGTFYLRLPEGLEVRTLSAGFNPEICRWAQASGLILALEPDESNSWVPPAMVAGRTIYLTDPSSENFGSILQMAKDRGAQAAWPDSARALDFGSAGIADARVMLAEFLTPKYISGRLWRAVWGRGSRLLVLPMPAEDGIETNLARLRGIARRLRDADFTFDLSKAAEPLSSWDAVGIMRCVLAFLLAVIGPLLAVRQGLAALRCVSCKTRWPQSYPVPELALGTLRTAAVAAGIGLACCALLSLPGWNSGLSRIYWDLWNFGVPMAFSILALYAEDFKGWRKWLERPLTYREALKAAMWFAVIALLIRPPHFPVYLLPERLWWLPLRWREALVGVPCLFMAFYIHLHRLESKHPRAGSDPRHWLILGLLAPIGTVHAFGLGLMPPEMLLAQTVQIFLIGAVLGGLLVAFV